MIDYDALVDRLITEEPFDPANPREHDDAKMVEAIGWDVNEIVSMLNTSRDGRVREFAQIFKNALNELQTAVS